MHCKISKWVFILCLPLLLLSFTYDKKDGINFETDGWNQVSKTAQESQKPIFIFVGTKYCDLSRRMEDVMGSNNEVGKFYNTHFVCIRMDPTEFWTNFRLTNWGIAEVPVTIFMNSKKKIVYKVNGYLGARKLIEEGQKAASIIEKENNRNIYTVNK